MTAQQLPAEALQQAIAVIEMDAEGDRISVAAKVVLAELRALRSAAPSPPPWFCRRCLHIKWKCICRHWNAAGRESGDESRDNEADRLETPAPRCITNHTLPQSKEGSRAFDIRDTDPNWKDPEPLA